MSVTAINDSEFKSKVLESGDVPVLVDFWAEWCGPCKMLAPALEQLSQELAGQLTCYKLDTDANPIAAGDYEITSIPCCIIFKNGKEIGRTMGFKPADKLKTSIKDILA